MNKLNKSKSHALRFKICFRLVLVQWFCSQNWIELSQSHYLITIHQLSFTLHKCVIDFDSTLKIILSIYYMLNVISNLTPNVLLAISFIIDVFIISRIVSMAVYPANRPACVLAAKQQLEWCWKLKGTKVWSWIRFLTEFGHWLRRSINLDKLVL